MMTDKIDQLSAALVAAQAEMPKVRKEADNPFFKSKYADLASIVSTASPILAKHGLAVSQFVAHDEDRNTMMTYLLHSSGQHIAHEMLLMLPKDDPQGQGSAITYARRYAYQAVIGMVTDEDDDGNKASRPKAPRKAQAVTQEEDGPVSAENAEALRERCATLGLEVVEVVKLGTSGRTTDPGQVLRSEVRAIKEAIDTLTPATGDAA